MFRKKLLAETKHFFNETKPVYNVIAVPDYGQTGWWCLTCREAPVAISQAENLDEALKYIQEAIHLMVASDEDFNKPFFYQIVMHTQNWVPTEQELDEMDAANEL